MNSEDLNQLEDHVDAAANALEKVGEWWETAAAELEAAQGIIATQDPGSDTVAQLAHRLWTHWSQHIAQEEDISQERLDRWQNLWTPFEELSEEMQDKDRELVDRFLDEQPDYEKQIESAGGCD